MEQQLCEPCCGVEHRDREHQGLLDLKTWLEQETATYHCLLEAEDAHCDFSPFWVHLLCQGLLPLSSDCRDLVGWHPQADGCSLQPTWQATVTSQQPRTPDLGKGLQEETGLPRAPRDGAGSEADRMELWPLEHTLWVSGSAEGASEAGVPGGWVLWQDKPEGC
ncbi:Keratin, type I cytoskeletal 42 [Plecturocebus cupreus]